MSVMEQAHPQAAPQDGPTLGDFFERYLTLHLARVRSGREAERMGRRYFVRFWHRPLGSITRMELVEWHHEIGQARPAAANAVIIRLCALFNKAVEWGVYNGPNPATRIRAFPRSPRERFLQSHELPRLWDSLATEPFDVQVYFRGLLWTAARRDELRTMQWGHLDLSDPAAGTWRKPTSKNGRSHMIPLTPECTAHLIRLAADGRAPYVFSKTGFGPWGLATIERYWGEIRSRAGLADVRIHDLRRTAASLMAASGENLTVIQHMLNHRDLSATHVYARLNLAGLRRALNANAERIRTLATASGNGAGPEKER